MNPDVNEMPLDSTSAKFNAKDIKPLHHEALLNVVPRTSEALRGVYSVAIASGQFD